MLKILLLRIMLTEIRSYLTSSVSILDWEPDQNFQNVGNLHSFKGGREGECGGDNPWPNNERAGSNSHARGDRGENGGNRDWLHCGEN